MVTPCIQKNNNSCQKNIDQDVDLKISLKLADSKYIKNVLNVLCLSFNKKKNNFKVYIEKSQTPIVLRKIRERHLIRRGLDHLFIDFIWF